MFAGLEVHTSNESHVLSAVLTPQWLPSEFHFKPILVNCTCRQKYFDLRELLKSFYSAGVHCCGVVYSVRNAVIYVFILYSVYR